MKILEKIAKLQASANSFEKSGNREAALVYANKVQKLLTKHKLSMAHVNIDTLNKKEPIDNEIIDPKHIKKGNKANYWVGSLACVVAKAHYCELIEYAGGSQIGFIGRKSDRVVAIYIFNYLLYICQLECQQEEKKAILKKGFSASFRRAFAVAVNQQYEKEKACQAKKPEENALIISSETAISSWIATNLKLKNKKRSKFKNLNREGLSAGSRSGAQADIHRCGISDTNKLLRISEKT